MSDGTHLAARVEERVRDLVEPVLRRRGWHPVVVPAVGYGGEGWVRILARVLLAPPWSTGQDREDGRGWRRFVSTEVSQALVTVRVGGHTHEVMSEGDGYVDAVVDSDLEPGWGTAEFSVEGQEPVPAPVRVVGPDTRLGLVSDIDDTVIETMLPRPLVAFRNAFLARESARRAVPGMADLYAEITAAHPDVFVVYLSTGAWNTVVPLTAFLRRHGYPPGPLLLTDWGPTPTGWFRSGQDHKRAQLRRLFDELPELRWLLVGDDGQHDPGLYADAAAAEPEKVLGIAIRQLSLAEQVVVHGQASAPDEHGVLPGDPVAAPDGFGLRDGLRARGIVLPG